MSAADRTPIGPQPGDYARYIAEESEAAARVKAAKGTPARVTVCHACGWRVPSHHPACPVASSDIAKVEAPAAGVGLTANADIPRSPYPLNRVLDDAAWEAQQNYRGTITAGVYFAPLMMRLVDEVRALRAERDALAEHLSAIRGFQGAIKMASFLVYQGVAKPADGTPAAQLREHLTTLGDLLDSHWVGVGVRGEGARRAAGGGDHGP